jgi:hypothetical protein
VSLVAAAGLGFAAFLLGWHQESMMALKPDEESPIVLGRLSTIDALSAALTQLASGTPGMAGERVVTVLRTFRDSTGRLCREFELSDTSPTTSNIGAIACHDGSAWWVEGAAWRSATGFGGGGEVIPASSEAPDKWAALLSRLGAGGALEREEEAAVIAGSWRKETAQ